MCSSDLAASKEAHVEIVGDWNDWKRPGIEPKLRDDGWRVASIDVGAGEHAYAIIEDGVAAGEFRRDLDVTHLVIHFIGLCFIYHSNRFSLSQSLELDLGSAAVKRRGLNQVLRLVFEGIAAEPR